MSADASGKKRILIMDDEEIIRSVVGVLLQHLGYDSAFAEEGQEALTLYREAMEAGTPFDVVVLDLTIPDGMGGEETIGKLKEMDPNVTAIVSTGYAGGEIVSNYQQYGFSAVVNKPFNMQGLQEVIEKVLAPAGA